MAIDRDQFITGNVNAASSFNVLLSSAVSSGGLIVAHGAVWTNNLLNTHPGTVTDNVNAGAYSTGCESTMASDTQVISFIHYKLNISSGAGANTYRVSFNSSAASANRSGCVIVYTGGPFVAGSTGSSNGTSSSPRPPLLTQSSNPALFVTNAVHNSTTTFNSAISIGTFVTTVDPTNANQILCVAESTNSQSGQQPTFGMNTSTRWGCNMMIFTGLGGGGAAAIGEPWRGCLMGIQ